MHTSWWVLGLLLVVGLVGLIVDLVDLLLVGGWFLDDVDALVVNSCYSVECCWWGLLCLFALVLFVPVALVLMLLIWMLCLWLIIAVL